MKDFVDLETYCMGTNVIQRVYKDKGYETVSLAKEELIRLENILSFFKPLSEVSLLNDKAGEDYVKLSSETYYIIKKAKKYSKMCGGVFDITAAPLISTWGIFTKNQRVPDLSEIIKAKALINFNDILLDENSCKVKLKNKNEKIDLGGIAKGFAADKVKEIYRKNEIQSAFINIGGNVLAVGKKPDGSKWNIGVQNPLEPRGNCIGLVAVEDKSVVTSGDYVRYFIEDGEKYHHILDPRTGYPARSGIMSVTLITENSIDADALSTAAFILGLQEGMKLIKSIKNAEAIFITKDKDVYATKGIKDDFTFTGEDEGYTYRREE